MDLLYPPGGGDTDTKKWDITLTACILKDLIPSSPQQEAAIKDIREVRNRLYGHISEFAMGKNEFKNSWRDVMQVLQDGANILLTDPGNFNLQSMVDDIQKEKVTNVDILKDTFQSWKESDRDVFDAIAEQNAKLEFIGNTVHRIARKQHIHIDGE